jgi:hypothetical protein
LADDETTDTESEDDVLLVEIQARYEAARNHASQWRKESKDSYAMYAGDHWSQDDQAKMVEQQRTPVTFNRAAILIDAVIGYEVNNRQETRFIGRTQGDAKVNEKLTEAARFFRDQCDAEFEESDAFRDMAICGMGWTNDRLSDQQNPDYDLVRDRVDPFEMLWDPSCKKPCLADKRYVFRKKWMDKQEAKAIFPNWDGSYSPADWLHDDDPDTEEKIKNPRNAYKGENDEASPTRDVPVLEYQYVKSENEYELTNPLTGEVMKLDEAAWEKIDKETKTAFPNKQKKRNVWRRCFLIGGEIVKKDQPFPNGCTYDCVTGKRDRNKSYWFGLMKSLRDPQMWSNKFLAQIMHLINTSAKPGYDMEDGAVKDQAKFETNAARPGAINVFTDGALQKQRVQRREVAGLPPDLANLLEYANDSMSDVSGVNQELLGMADREQAGVLEYQRKQSAVTLLAPLFDSFRRYRKMSAKTWLYFMQTYMTDGRLIRITQDKQAQQPEQPIQPGQPQAPQMQGRMEVNVPFTKEFFDPNVAEYDVIIDQGASSPNLKEATWAAIQPMLPLMAERMGPEEVALVLEYSPMPESFMEKMRAIQAQKSQQPPPPDPAMVKAQADIEKGKAELNMDGQRLQMEGQKIAMEQEAKQRDNALEEQRMLREFALKEKLAMMEFELKEKLALLDANLRVQEHAQDMELKVEDAMVSNTLKAEGQAAKNAATEAKAVNGSGKSNGKGKPAAQPAMGPITQVLKALADGQKMLAQAITAGNEQVIAAVTAPKTVRAPNGGAYQITVN